MFESSSDLFHVRLTNKVCVPVLLCYIYELIQGEIPISEYSPWKLINIHFISSIQRLSLWLVAIKKRPWSRVRESRKCTCIINLRHIYDLKCKKISFQSGKSVRDAFLVINRKYYSDAYKQQLVKVEILKSAALSYYKYVQYTLLYTYTVTPLQAAIGTVHQTCFHVNLLLSSLCLMRS